MEGDFQRKLKNKMHVYVKEVYRVSRTFPQDELYGVTSQLRRSTLSVILNFIEGYARFKPKTTLNFYEISYGSLKESKYIIYFSYTEKFLQKEDYENIFTLSEEISKMLWRLMKPLRDSDA